MENLSGQTSSQRQGRDATWVLLTGLDRERKRDREWFLL